MKSFLSLLLATFALSATTQAAEMMQFRCKGTTTSSGIFYRNMSLDCITDSRTPYQGTMTLGGINLTGSSTSDHGGTILNDRITLDCAKADDSLSFGLIQVGVALVKKLELGLSIGKGICAIETVDGPSVEYGAEVFLGGVTFKKGSPDSNE